jgi:hypothetical protein
VLIKLLISKTEILKLDDGKDDDVDGDGDDDCACD